ncbi:ATP-grasp fold amidoligase family protein [Facklamia hominis]|uniref:ATP-grasp fold amidoligase family protein n=1 Tax=Facklamia hominis TaxID=178214 RepID=UPI000C7CC633|nr:ATP-grasp fold amidoligase family protein [Facklamia hominis]PKY93795.1 glycosyltransferase [Facklamia hominis]
MNIKDKIVDWFPYTYNLYYRFRYNHQKKVKYLHSMSIEDKKIYLNNIYRDRIGRTINWENPSSYTEKIQWSKLFDNTNQKTYLSDKNLVKDWVKSRIGESYVIKSIGVYDTFEEIDFSKMPQRFVLKTNHGSGTNIIVKNKDKLNIRSAKYQFERWMSIDYGALSALEFHYSNISRKIIAEEYMVDQNGELNDFRFLCFNGEPYYIIFDDGAYKGHKRNIYNLNWELQPWNQGHFKNTESIVEPPKNLDKMIDIARILSKDIPHVRVDLYNVDGAIYFGEMTFTNASGFQPILPEKCDYELGSLWDLPKN